MNASFAPNLNIALTHYPVVNKNGDTIASAVTNLDLHDIARAARTYGLRRFYVITPLADQKRLIQKIVDHWVSGAGGKANPARREALALIGVTDDIQGAVEDIRQATDLTPHVVATCAKPGPARISFGRFKERLASGKPHLLVLGTAWGLSETLITAADYILEPIQGGTGYNHLSVRCAAAIMLDRLLGGGALTRIAALGPPHRRQRGRSGPFAITKKNKEKTNHREPLCRK